MKSWVNHPPSRKRSDTANDMLWAEICLVLVTGTVASAAERNPYYTSEIFLEPVRNFERNVMHDEMDQSPPLVYPGRRNDDVIGKIRENRASRSRFEQLGATCWLCCTLNMSTGICGDKSMCQSESCVKYVVKSGTLASLPLPIPFRGARRLTMGVGSRLHNENELCKQNHDNVEPIRALPGLLEPCTYHCIVGSQMSLFTHTKSNGVTCLQDKVCWDGQCVDQAEPEDMKFCERLFPGRKVEPIAKLSCQVTCRTTDDGEMWTASRSGAPDCDPPDWLPKKIENHEDIFKSSLP